MMMGFSSGWMLVIALHYALKMMTPSKGKVRFSGGRIRPNDSSRSPASQLFLTVSAFGCGRSLSHEKNGQADR